MEDYDPIAEALNAIATQLKYLGTGTAETPQGAIEILASEIKEMGAAISSGLSAIAEAIHIHGE